MTLKQLLKTYPTVVALIIASAVFAGLTYTVSPRVAVVEAAVIFILGVIMLIRSALVLKGTQRLISELSSKLNIADEASLNSFPFPLVVSDERGKIKWYNDLFCSRLIGDTIISGELSEFTEGMSSASIEDEGRLDLRHDGLCYSVYSEKVEIKSKPHLVLFYIDDTKLKDIAAEYEDTRPAVLLLAVDSVDELGRNYRDSERAEIRTAVERMIENWTANYSCLMRKLSADNYLVVAQERNLRDMTAKRFDILDLVRTYQFKGETVGITLSIGVSKGGNFSECEAGARQALDMALGRGGDQAAIRKKDLSYEFFGGVSKSVEKRAKVKTRIVASAISELIKGSDNVFVMGHRFPDLDALGSAVGFIRAPREMEVPAYIVMDRSKSLAAPLLERLRREGLDDTVVGFERANELFTHNSLLIVVDTHIADFTEFPELCRRARKICVIDHHRKAVDHIADAVVFYHDPSASSSAEMVTELLQYMADVTPVSKLEAEALLSGIMLDTKNFVLRAGVRTFEAAAYLRGRGADTVAVKKLFSTSLESCRRKNGVVVNAEIFRSCAISIADFTSEDIRIICSQACDEMLNVNNIDAAFVIFETDDGAVNISARSLGALNVQVVMETLGGGGHRTMAAAQLYGISEDTAAAKLQSAIDDYYNARNSEAL